MAGRGQESRTMGATAAMERAETATAIRRASRTRIGAATVSRVCAEPETINEQDSSFDGSVSKLLQPSERTLIWVADQLDGLTLPGLTRQQAPEVGSRLSAHCHRTRPGDCGSHTGEMLRLGFGASAAADRSVGAGLLAVSCCNRGRCQPRRAGQISLQGGDRQSLWRPSSMRHFRI